MKRRKERGDDGDRNIGRARAGWAGRSPTRLERREARRSPAAPISATMPAALAAASDVLVDFTAPDALAGPSRRRGRGGHADRDRHDRPQRRASPAIDAAAATDRRCCRPPTPRSASICSRSWSREAARAARPGLGHRDRRDAPSPQGRHALGHRLAARRRRPMKGAASAEQRRANRLRRMQRGPARARGRRHLLRLAARRLGRRRPSRRLRRRGRADRARPPRRKPRDLRHGRGQGRALARRQAGRPLHDDGRAGAVSAGAGPSRGSSAASACSTRPCSSWAGSSARASSSIRPRWRGMSPTPVLIVGVWLIGGLIAIAGAFVYAELAARRPEVGGQYAYLRDAWGPMPAFLYGWSLLLVIQSGGMAAVAITFARYFLELTALAARRTARSPPACSPLLTAINCLGVRAGSNVQSVLMVLKIAAIVALVAVRRAARRRLCRRRPAPPRRRAARPARRDRRGADPGDVRLWRLADGELRRRRDARSAPRSRPRAAARRGRRGHCSTPRSPSPASTCSARPGWPRRARRRRAVMRLALGDTGATLIALGIAISALGFLSQGMLTTPRVYFAMAEDRLFFRERRQGQRAARACRSSPSCCRARRRSRSRCPARYGQILSYVVSVDFIWFGADRRGLVRLPPPRPGRRRRLRGARPSRSPPACSSLACAVIVAATVCNNPVNSAIGFAILPRAFPPSSTGSAAGDDGMRVAAVRLYALGQDPDAPVRYNLASSEVPHFRMDRWAIDLADARARWRQPLPLPAAARGDRRQMRRDAPTGW